MANSSNWRAGMGWMGFWDRWGPGRHALLPLESAEQERALIERGRRAGVDLHGLHSHGYWCEPGGDQPAALIIGYATPPAGPGPWPRSPKWYRVLIV